MDVHRKNNAREYPSKSRQIMCSFFGVTKKEVPVPKRVTPTLKSIIRLLISLLLLATGGTFHVY
jgi:hypothetical protein